MTMLQVRNVPDEVHRQLKARAALEGMTLSDWALRELSRSLERPSRQELLERVRSRGPAPAGADAAALVRAERDAR
jgi:antitoxin FitA